MPSEFYTDERFFELSKEKIFARTWQFAGRTEDLSVVTPIDVVGEPLLLTKADSGLHCMSNVCTHRGKILVEEPCEANLIRCGYHGRRFSLDGKFLSMPEFEGVESFPSVADDLASVPVDHTGGFSFVSLDPVDMLAEFVSDEAIMPMGKGKLKLSSTNEYRVNAHWALYCENYLEGFHIPFVHKSLNEIVDFVTYSTELFRYASVQTGYEADGKLAARYLFIFPNTMFNFYPWGVSVNVVRPVSSSESVVEYLTYVSDESLVDEGAGADLHGVELEDEAIVESVQRGIRSRYYSHGRYSPTREQGTHHFHRLIAEFFGQ
ncbi:MAG: aromatic ring-hydroxylating dioxygenase subunit alpha [bacterium]|nr:aromatic ring-hydroxylating dioxygenase subunit alpha [bacterium]